MAKMSIIIPDDIYKRFRMKVLEKLGTRKGAVSQAVAEAMEKWVKDP
jgi:hypothetical protein